MFRHMLCLLCLLISPAFPAPVSGQDTPVILTLESAIDLALKESYDARDLALQLLRAEQNRSAARGRFKTNADLTLRAPNFTEQVQAINVPNQPTAYNTTGSIEWQSEDVATRSYEISLARFDNGDITSQELALDRDRLTQARTAYLDAYIQYQLATADLKRQTLYDFENDRSLVETPRED